MNTAVMKTAQAATRTRGRSAGSKELTPASYSNPAINATPEQMIVEQKLGWHIATLHNPRLRPADRQRLLLGAGRILLDFLGRQMPRAIR